MVEQNGGKFRKLEKSSKNRFLSESNVFSRNVIALCADSDEKIKKIRYGLLKSKKRERKITPRGVSGVKISFAAN